MSEWKTRITKVQVVKPAKESGEACLVLIYPPGPDMGKRFPLARDEIVLGRGADCDIQVDRDSVSRRHARVFRSGDSWLSGLLVGWLVQKLAIKASRDLPVSPV